MGDSLGKIRLDKLTKFLDGRTVCFQSCGPTIANLERYPHVIPKDVVWIAHNVYLPTERILEPIGYRLDLVYVSAQQSIRFYPKYREFLERPDDNLLLTTIGGTEQFNTYEPGLVSEFVDKLIVADVGDSELHTPDAFSLVDFKKASHVFSFISTFLMLIKAGAREIVCFGLDGGKIAGYDNWYYGVYEDYPEGWFHGMPNGYNTEIDYLHRNWDRLLHEACGLKPDDVRILNCSPHSKIECFPKIAYEDLAMVFQKRML